MESSTPTPSRQEAVEAAIDKENLLRVARNRRIKKHQSFPRQRIGALSKLLLYRNDGPCLTDDGEMWFDLVAPFFVRASRMEGKDPFASTLKWAERFVPAFLEEIGADGVASRVSAIVEQRDAARAAGAEWLPMMPEIVSTLLITLEEVRAVGLRGFGSINPPTDEERKARRRDHAEQVRRAKGMKPRASCTLVKKDEALAARLGVVARTIRRWRRAGTLEKKVAAMETALPAPAMSKTCDRHIPLRDGGHTSWTSATSPEVIEEEQLSPATLDDIRAEAEAKVVLELGFKGENYTFQPDTLRDVVDRHPVLRREILRHAEAVDARMRKTPRENARRVARNLFADQARATIRSASQKTKIAA